MGPRCPSGGSPPRAWRAAGLSFGGSPVVRFTSTCVESRHGRRVRRAEPPVHLHVRGEQAALDVSVELRIGSPPRAWRAELYIINGQEVFWFTSTCVESRINVMSTSSSASVHLHVRGEQTTSRSPSRGTRGSPPRAWRAGAPRQSKTAQGRFTSTCVESSPSLAAGRGLLAVHLHVRGEQAELISSSVARSGSPPRAWRAAAAGGGLARLARFTSTCVESSTTDHPPRRACTVHLHVRGEQSVLSSLRASTRGSPPRAWRAAEQEIRGRKIRRFTSTCVESRRRGTRAG